MSKNYEVLHEAGRDREIFRTAAGAKPAVVPGSERRGRGKDLRREEILKLIQSVFLTGDPCAPRLVVFSGVERGNGCSWVCARAGEALAARIEGKVCLVDANLHAPSLHRFFGVDHGSDLTDALLQAGPVEQFARPIRGGNLWLLSGRPVPSEVAGVVSPERLRNRFLELCLGFSYVLLDTPPVNESADALMFGKMADGMVLVLAAHATHRDAARKAKERLEAAEVRLLGAVLNKRTYPIPEALYSRI
jgi:Mrp family chromosome partitioning ATPase